MGSEALEIIYFGNDWFAENKTSSHHIAEQLAKHHRVLYVECPGLRAPKSNVRDLKKLFRKLRQGFTKPTFITPNLAVCTLLQIPLHRFALVRWLNRKITYALIKHKFKSFKISQPILWFVIPHLPHLAQNLKHRLSVYYCIDDYSAMPGVNPVEVKKMDEQMTKTANLVFAASEEIFKTKKQINHNTYLSEHGVDFDHFSRVYRGDVDLALEMKSLPSPVIGFFGLIEEWIDLSLIEHIAKQKPGWQIVLIGRCAVNNPSCFSYKNIHYLGCKAFADLPSYASAFDVAILPYKLTRQVMHCNPIKLREYLATGKPVVSVRFPEAERYKDVVLIADNQQEFINQLERALTQDTNQARQKRINSVKSQTWEARVTNVLIIVNEYLNPNTSKDAHNGS